MLRFFHPPSFHPLSRFPTLPSEGFLALVPWNGLPPSPALSYCCCAGAASSALLSLLTSSLARTSAACITVRDHLPGSVFTARRGMPRLRLSLSSMCNYSKAEASGLLRRVGAAHFLMSSEQGRSPHLASLPWLAGATSFG